MFTGLVEEQGKVVRIRKRGKSVLLSLQGMKTTSGLHVDDSIGVEGVCLTVIRKRGRIAEVQAVEETLEKTTIGRLHQGSPVNLERPMKAYDRVGGHFVLGHVDGIGTVSGIRKRTNSWMMSIKVARRFQKYLIPVGSVAVNGVSLTVAELRGNVFGVSIIPHTWEVTTMKTLRLGDRVNVEFDVLGKYVDRLLQFGKVKRKR
jgi:riboflavin synthase